jgi:hypothetical protein
MAEGNWAVEIARVEEFKEGETTRGTAGDSCPVSLSCTFSSTVAGAATILLPTAPDSVLESTTVVASALPFQRITALLVKFVPVTFIMRFGEPAAIV